MLAISSIVLLNTGLVETVRADKTEAASTQQATDGRMHGEVTDVIDAAGYTYADGEFSQQVVATRFLRALFHRYLHDRRGRPDVPGRHHAFLQHAGRGV